MGNGISGTTLTFEQATAAIPANIEDTSQHAAARLALLQMYEESRLNAGCPDVFPSQTVTDVAGCLEVFNKWGCPGHAAVVASMQSIPVPPGATDEDQRSATKYLEYYTNISLLDEKWPMDKKAPQGAAREAALRWLHAALIAWSTEHKREYKQPCMWLLSSNRLWPYYNNVCGEETEEARLRSEPEFVALKALAASKLQKLSDAQEKEVYQAQELATKLGNLGDDIEPMHPRQDTHAGLTFDFEEPYDGPYSYLLWFASMALNDAFNNAAKAAVEKVVPGVVIKFCSPKGTARMMAKFISDHVKADLPRSAENVDNNRMAWIVEANDFALAYESIKEIGTIVRVKNAYSAEFDAASVSFGYRALLVNVVFDSLKTWREYQTALQAIEVKRRKEETNRMMKTGYVEEDAHGVYQQYNEQPIAQLMTEGGPLLDKPAKLVCEIQMMTPAYFTMRKQSHAWYKIIRADTSRTMIGDYKAAISFEDDNEEGI